MGCCDSKEKNGSYLVTAPRKREFILRNVDPRLTKDNFDRIIQFLEIDEALKLLKLNKKIRTLLPEYVKLNHMVKKLNSNKDNELDLNSLISDISKFIYEYKMSDDFIIKAICLNLKRKILNSNINSLRIKVSNKKCLELLCVICDYLDINHQNYRKTQEKIITLDFSGHDHRLSYINETLLKNYFLNINNLLLIVNNIEVRDLSLETLFQVLKTEENYISLLDISCNTINLFNVYSLINLLKENNYITSLYIRNSGLTDQEASAFCEILKGNKSIQILELSCNKLTNLFCKVISEALKSNKTLKDLFIAKNMFTNDGIKYLIDGLVVNRYLRCLDISNNNLSYESSIYLCVFLKNTKSLEKIMLIGNNFGNDGLKNIFEGLVFNMSIRVIFLDNNKVADLFGFQIKEIIQNSHLQFISLSNNNFSDITAEYISNAIVHNQNLISLNLNNNRITDFGVNLLLTSIKNKENFKNLIITNNKYSNEVGKKINKFSNRFNFNDTTFIAKEYFYLSEKYINFNSFQDK